MSADLDTPLTIVTCDAHIGPRLIEDLRPYCPAGDLDAFDEFAVSVQAHREDVYRRMPTRSNAQFSRNRKTAGHYDPAARRRDMDYDGVAAEIIFHGSQNEEPIPFGTFVVFLPPTSDDLGQVALGRHIYNQWLADFCRTAPHRHIGLAQLPMWDVDAAIAELEWAAAAGLRGVNFPAPGKGLAPYNHPQWEPFWAACADLAMPLTTHSGSGNPEEWIGREANALMSIESGGWFSRRAMHQMIFGGVFERHPKLKLVLTEQPGDWFASTMRELDSAYLAHSAAFADQVPRMPSEYAREHVAIGASFLANFEAHDAIEHGYAHQVMWGSDYPHMEGTFQRPDIDGDPSVGKVAMRGAFHDVAPEHVAAMAGLNACRVYGLDTAALGREAVRISAPTQRDLSQPVDEIPPIASKFAFRKLGAWA